MSETTNPGVNDEPDDWDLIAWQQHHIGAHGLVFAGDQGAHTCVCGETFLGRA